MDKSKDGKDNVLVLPEKEKKVENKFDFPDCSRPRIKPIVPGPGMVKILQQAGYNTLTTDPYPDAFYGVIVQMAKDIHELRVEVLTLKGKYSEL